jgi:hypothetical protein
MADKVAGGHHMAEDDETLDLLRAHRAAGEKYAYFLLAAVGAAMAFALNQTRDLPLSWSQLPLALAVLCWGLSFFFGCLRLSETGGFLREDYQRTRLMRGTHPDFPPSPQSPQLIEHVDKRIKQRAIKVGKLATWQFQLLIAGAVFYVIWHVLGMYLRTI